MHSQWGCTFPVSHIAIPGEDVYFIVIHPHREWRCALPGIGMRLTGNAHSLYRVKMSKWLSLNVRDCKSNVGPTIWEEPQSDNYWSNQNSENSHKWQDLVRPIIQSDWGSSQMVGPILHYFRRPWHLQTATLTSSPCINYVRSADHKMWSLPVGPR